MDLGEAGSRGRGGGLQADEAGGGGRALQERAPHQVLVALRIVGMQPALVGERHHDPLPGQVLRGQRPVQRLGRAPAGQDQESRAAFGDVLRLDARAGSLEVLAPETDWAARPPAVLDLTGNEAGDGRELFAVFRRHARSAEEGGTALW